MNCYLFAHSKPVLILLIVLSLFINACDSDINSPKNTYEVLFDSTYYVGGQWSEASDILEVSSGGFIIAGRIGGQGNSAALLRINDNGNQVWKNIYSGSRLQSVIETNDNGFVAVGKSETGAYILKTDQHGNVVWEQTIDFFPYVEDIRKVIQTADGDLIVPINSYEVNTNAKLVRLSSGGSIKWTKNIEGVNRTYIYAVSEEPSGNLKLLGGSNIDSAATGWLLTLDRNGTELNRNLINTNISAIGSTWHELSTIRNNTGGFAGVGWEFFIVTDSSGNLNYKNAIPTPYGYDQIRLYSLFQKNNNEYIAGGFLSEWVKDDSTNVWSSQTFGGLFFLNSEGVLTGNIVLNKKCNNNSVTSVIVSRDNSILASGYYSSCDSTRVEFWVQKIRML
ncbi:MAG: hypothetical protein IPM56_02970 [Ignavibacteriales bacterium]|nr:MAG: hypothetical protein IPM56_02970 [Ignavibacteriales bacterium]